METYVEGDANRDVIDRVFGKKDANLSQADLKDFVIDKNIKHKQ